MKRNVVLGLLLVLLTVSKIEAQEKPVQLAVPANLKVSVTGRLMTVTWDPVQNAAGYIVHTASKGCGSGSRIVNTFTKTVTNHAGTKTNSETAAKGVTTKGNGFVTFTGPTSFTIWLMAEKGSSTKTMASSLTAKVKAVGNNAENIIDSEYSKEVTINKSQYN